MQTSDYQRCLRAISVCDLVGGAILVMLGGFVLFEGLVGGQVNPLMELRSSLALAGSSLALGTFSLFTEMLGAAGFCCGVFNMALGFFGLRASRDASKIRPVWMLSLIALVFCVLGLVTGISFGLVLPTIFVVAVADITFWFANNIKSSLAAQAAVA